LGALAAAVLLAFAAALAGCGGAVYDAANSPVLETAALETYNEGTDETQYIRVTLGFDREISVAKGYAPSIQIAGDAVENSRIASEAAGADLIVTVGADKVRNGDLTLTLAGRPPDELAKGVRDASGQYAAKNDKTVEALTPSGVVLAPAGDGAVSVEHRFNIRGIAWALFTDGGEVVGDSLLAGADTLDGAVALHGHAFLTDDEYDVAANLAETLTSHFGDRYTFTADGKTVTARRGEAGGGTSSGLSISLYTYALVV
jgi:hypothetical protein